MADEAQSRRQAELDLVHLPAVGRHGADVRAPGREHDPILAEERQRRRREGRRWAGPAAPSHNGPDAEGNELVAHGPAGDTDGGQCHGPVRCPDDLVALALRGTQPGAPRVLRRASGPPDLARLGRVHLGKVRPGD
ncbi:hypothetical protein Pelo_19560 [Pelomyxa schiedti]|nr:hypothetical protein Pelo_19560 [Pelomyxa schiedti]